MEKETATRSNFPVPERTSLHFGQTHRWLRRCYYYATRYDYADSAVVDFGFCGWDDAEIGRDYCVCGCVLGISGFYNFCETV